MNKIKLPQAARLTSPNPVTLVCTQRPDSSTNLATVSWWTYLSFHPNMIAYAMAKTSYSGEMVRNNKKVILTIPGAEIAEAVMAAAALQDGIPIKQKSLASNLQKWRTARSKSLFIAVCNSVQFERISRGGRPLPVYLRCRAGLRQCG